MERIVISEWKKKHKHQKMVQVVEHTVDGNGIKRSQTKHIPAY